jgi:hypothetical protein
MGVGWPEEDRFPFRSMESEASPPAIAISLELTA